MRFLTTVLLAAGAVTAQTTLDCHANNCLRAVRATQFPTRALDCSSYFQATVTPATVTITQTAPRRVTVTETIPTVFTVLKTTRARQKRQATEIPTEIPTYATACTDASAYESACSCIGVTRTTLTLATPSTTITVTNTRTIKTYQPTATVRPFILYVDEVKNHYVSPASNGPDYIAVFTNRESKAQLFYIDPDTSILQAIGIGQCGTYWADDDADFLWLSGSQNAPAVCSVDDNDRLSCTSGHFTQIGQYADGYSLSMAVPGVDWDAYVGGPVSPKVIWKA
ncbi:hypothetical protein H072_522 [Dactylellina haptotyla CBS 200.50]|uniref:Uncharacterized protein n=1 Tax=Dactylellina haptotyla (strain CBS 200.50) TaxID=1284197 RepID=S8AWW2_DACHA|nr:hypothetical protein H072_522 [Dactylellina haptotyla CBS 200.50]